MIRLLIFSGLCCLYASLAESSSTIKISVANERKWNSKINEHGARDFSLDNEQTIYTQKNNEEKIEKTLQQITIKKINLVMYVIDRNNPDPEWCKEIIPSLEDDLRVTSSTGGYIGSTMLENQKQISDIREYCRSHCNWCMEDYSKDEIEKKINYFYEKNKRLPKGIKQIR